MSEKPFWEGKTCEEMAGLPVKAVLKNGVTITGQLSRFGDIPISTEGMNSPISISSNTLNFRPHREISSVELLDSLSSGPMIFEPSPTGSTRTAIRKARGHEENQNHARPGRRHHRHPRQHRNRRTVSPVQMPSPHDVRRIRTETLIGHSGQMGPASHERRGGSMSQRCDPHGPGCYYRCPICGQWWRYDPLTEFWDPINTLGMFFSHHSVWRQERQHRKANHGRTD